MELPRNREMELAILQLVVEVSKHIEPLKSLFGSIQERDDDEPILYIGNDDGLIFEIEFVCRQHR